MQYKSATQRKMIRITNAGEQHQTLNPKPQTNSG
jgi:hypothetical protein